MITKYVRAGRERGNTMKNTRKLLALWLALILTLGCLTAWAEGEPELPAPEQGESAAEAAQGSAAGDGQQSPNSVSINAQQKGDNEDLINFIVKVDGNTDIINGADPVSGVSWNQEEGKDPVVTIDTDVNHADESNEKSAIYDDNSGTSHTVNVNGDVNSQEGTGIYAYNKA